MRKIDARRGLESLVTLLASVQELPREEYRGGGGDSPPPTGRGLMQGKNNHRFDLNRFLIYIKVQKSVHIMNMMDDDDEQLSISPDCLPRRLLHT